MKPIKRVALDTVEGAIKLAIERVWEWSDQFSPKRMPWLDGVVVQATLAAGNNTVEHGLGRSPRGFVVIGFDGASSAALPSMVSKNTRSMVLNSGATMVLTLWVWG